MNSGDLSEAALHQGSRTDTISIGAAGGWNSTTVPRHYYIQQKENWETTDADIRGGLDGLILALNIDSWSNSASSLKVSQILDLYYSPRGVFNSSLRACNRKNLQTTVAPSEILTPQTVAFNDLLNREARLDGTLTSSVLITIGEKAVENFLNYLRKYSILALWWIICPNRFNIIYSTQIQYIYVLVISHFSLREMHNVQCS